jgi:hypothetical protein
LRWGAALVPGGARAPWTPPARQSTGTCTRQAAERAPAGRNMLKSVCAGSQMPGVLKLRSHAALAA